MGPAAHAKGCRTYRAIKGCKQVKTLKKTVCKQIRQLKERATSKL